MFCFLFVSEECLVRSYAVTIGKIIQDIEMLVLVEIKWLMGEPQLQERSPEWLGNLRDVRSDVILTYHKEMSYFSYLVGRTWIDF